MPACRFSLHSMGNGASNPLFLHLLFRPSLENAFQFAGLLNLGHIPKSYSLSIHELDARGRDPPLSNPGLQCCPWDECHPGDLNCRVKFWTHKADPIT